MARGETPVADTILDITAASLARTELDDRVLILVRLAALAAVDAPVASYLLHIGAAAEAEVTLDDAEDVLCAIASIVGTPRTAAAAGRITEALSVAMTAIADAVEAGEDAEA